MDGNFYKEKTCVDGSIRALMGSTSEKMYLYQVPNWVLNNKAKTRAGDLHEKGVLV
jgi:hypothetical protein